MNWYERTLRWTILKNLDFSGLINKRPIMYVITVITLEEVEAFVVAANNLKA